MTSISINATIILIEDNPTPTSAYYSSNFLIIPTNNEQIDEEVRAARVIGANLGLPLPPLPHQQDASPAQQMNQEEEEAKIPEDNNNDRSLNSIKENNENEQKKANKSNIIAGIIGASSSGMVAMIAIGILVWHNSRRRQHLLSSNKDNPDSPKGNNERKDPILFSLPGEPMIARAEATTTTLSSSHEASIAAASFNEWDQQQQRNIFKFPSSVTYSALFPATTNTTANNNNSNRTTSNQHEEEWSSDTGSSESLSIRNLSTCDSVEENTAVTDTITSVHNKQQRMKQSNLVGSTLSVIHSQQSTLNSLSSHQKQLNPSVIDKNNKNELSLVNKKLLHYPPRSRHDLASSSIKNSDKENHDNASNEMSSYNLDKLFYPSEVATTNSSLSSSSTLMSNNHQPQQNQLIRLLRQHYFVTPFDLPPSRFLPLQNCPFQLVTRQSILDDPEKRQGVHEIP
ncbi:hypothetical protein INT45_006926 [Circinella minor]|uniref:Uncharacterized protein n=1 Tax=Circinella minor TaxID=1195481 RepID=A0A8H7S2J7_9FUNG|nr:hypothetical protein INT45_006926 [Circinella minor]